ncbi:hypothetical protein ACFLY5_00305 [Patescibacteria group bacterium]
MIVVRRYKNNPILKPDSQQSWEAVAVFNGCPIKKDGKTFLLYRAISLPHYHSAADIKMNVSDIGIAESSDGFDFSKKRRFIVPEHSWEKYGCEDPRITKLGDKYYVFYTALSSYPFNADGIKVGVAISKDLETIDEKHLVTPFNAKAMALFPEKINGKMCAILSANTDIPPGKTALAFFDKEEDIWSEIYWKKWYEDLDNRTLPLLRDPRDHVEVGAPPIKTKYGWLLVYSYIRGYFSNQKIFGIESVLLDIKDPSKIISRTLAPIMVPTESYELYGVAPNIVFPSGVDLVGDDLRIYYGAADTTCCVATVGLKGLVETMSATRQSRLRLKRAEENPIISPLAKNPWEAKATFNPAAIYLGGKVHIVYRAMSLDNTSVMGYAESKDGINIDIRHKKPIYEPREDFEMKKRPNVNSGCEDPRLVQIDNSIYMFYTAFDGEHPPRIAVTDISVDNFLKKKWRWSTPALISPPDWDNKDACVFPEKVDGKYVVVHRMGTDIDIALVPDLKFESSLWLEERRWLKLRPGHWDDAKVGLAAPPVKTDKGWIMLYHGISSVDHFYRVGAVLLDKNDATKIIGRTDYPIMSPRENYEMTGQVNNVVFPCGNVIMEDTLYVYYGGADSVVGLATVKIQDLLNLFDTNPGDN